MAEYWSNNDRGYRLRMWVDLVGQHSIENYSNVRFRLAILNTSTTFAGYSCSAFIDGIPNAGRQNWSNSSFGMTGNNQTVMLIDTIRRIYHNDVGDKSFKCNAKFTGSGGYSPGTLLLSFTYTLPNIPRASGCSAGTALLGENLHISIDKKNDSFRHKISYSWQSKSGVLAENVDSGYDWTLPMDFANDIPTSTSSNGTITVETYSGSNRIGQSQTSFTANVPDSVIPALGGIKLTDTNNKVKTLINKDNTFLQILSSVQCDFINATGVYGSNIIGYRAEIVDKNNSVTENGQKFDVFSYNGNYVIRASVTDSRGRSSEPLDVPIEIIHYAPPAIKIDAVRTRSNPNIIQVTRTAKISPVTVDGIQKNPMFIAFSVASYGSSVFSDDNGPANISSLTISELIESSALLGKQYPANESYSVVARIWDNFLESSSRDNVPTETVPVSIYKTGVGINKIWERGAVDVNGQVYVNDALIQAMQLTNDDGSGKPLPEGTLNSVVKAGFYTVLKNTSDNPFGNNSSGHLFQVDNVQYLFDILGQMAVREVNKEWVIIKSVPRAIRRDNVAIGYGLTATLKRIDDEVTLVIRNTINNQVPDGARKMGETIPSGFRPISPQSVVTSVNVGATIMDNTYHFDFIEDGSILNRSKGLMAVPKEIHATATWKTSDPWPE